MERNLPIVRPIFPKLLDSHWEPTRWAEHFDAVLQTGMVTNNGVFVRQFEAALTKYLGVPTICFSSGTAALIAMLKSFKIGFGDEVICPSFTFPATIQAVELCGATVVYADIVGDGVFTLDPVDVEMKITGQTKAILGVDVYGIPSSYSLLAEVARRRGIRCLFDSAPAFGSRSFGEKVGGFGDGQIFSFHATKPFTTMEGGCFCSHDQSAIEEAKAIRNFGQRSPSQIGPVGFNGKMMEVCALIGLEQLKTFDKVVERRRKMAALMWRQLSLIEGIRVAAVNWHDQEPNWCYLPILVEREFGMTRGLLHDRLLETGIETRIYYQACHTMSGPYCVPWMPATLNAASKVLSLPVYNDMTEAEVSRIVTAIREIQKCGIQSLSPGPADISASPSAKPLSPETTASALSTDSSSA